MDGESDQITTTNYPNLITYQKNDNQRNFMVKVKYNPALQT